MKIGVLALQGAFIEHEKMLNECGVEAVEVRKPEQLTDIDGLIIPGGESTAMARIAEPFHFFDYIRDFIKSGKPVYGTCAGMILLSNKVSGQKIGGQELIGGMDIETHRNFFGRQLDSFEFSFTVPDIGGTDRFTAVFIRAPAVLKCGPKAKSLGTLTVPVCEEVANKLKIVAGVDYTVTVAARQDNMLVTAFHPELTHDKRFHQYFVGMVNQYINTKK